jgi:hypothetical protein
MVIGAAFAIAVLATLKTNHSDLKSARREAWLTSRLALTEAMLPADRRRRYRLTPSFA